MERRRATLHRAAGPRERCGARRRFGRSYDEECRAEQRDERKKPFGVHGDDCPFAGDIARGDLQSSPRAARRTP
jgi:hypothetical protein